MEAVFLRLDTPALAEAIANQSSILEDDGTSAEIATLDGPTIEQRLGDLRRVEGRRRRGPKVDTDRVDVTLWVEYASSRAWSQAGVMTAARTRRGRRLDHLQTRVATWLTC